MQKMRSLTLNSDQLRRLQANMVVHSSNWMERDIEWHTDGVATKREFLGTVEQLDAFIAGASLHEPELEAYPDCWHEGGEGFGYPTDEQMGFVQEPDQHVYDMHRAQHRSHVLAWQCRNLPEGDDLPF